MAHSIHLANRSGYAHIDDYGRGVIGIFEVVFPSHVRARYLVGSFATGSDRRERCRYAL